MMNRRNDGRKPIIKKRYLIWTSILLVYIMLWLIILMPKTSANTEPIYIEHTVSGGETLWSIAKHYRPDADPREIVWEIQQASGCTALIRPGDVLLVPGVE